MSAAKETPPCTTQPAEPLRALAPCSLLPERYTSRARRIMWLKRIDHVHVREAIKRSGGKRYVIDIYMKLSQSHIPTQRPQLERTRAHHGRHTPNITVERRFFEFARLVSDFYDLAHAGHGFMPCTFCVAFVDYVLVSKPAPWISHKWFRSETSVCELLTQYVNNMIELTCRVKTYDDHCSCVGKLQVPELMEKFLSDEAGNV